MARSTLRLGAAVTLAVLTASGALAQTRIVAPTKDFIADAAQSDHFEIVEAQTALAQTQDPRVRAFAQEMIQAHTQTSQTLQAAASKAGMDAPPQGMNGDQQKMLSALQSQRGPEFDHVYLKQQSIAHSQAYDLEQAYAAHGANPDVRAAAQSAVPVIERHLAMAKQLRSQVGGE